jgi:hypothetical protein
VAFGRQRIPHARHVTEFGAVCTVCHSAEVHKAVTAKPETCAGCHHGPQNERCESCHRAQSAFYRGKTKTTLATLEPNVMVDAVSCTGCHDLSRKHSAQAVGDKCVACHDESYTSFLAEWTTDLARETARTAEVLRRAESALGRARKAGRKHPEAATLVGEARQALDLVRRARGAHNPEAAGQLLEASRRKAQAALEALARR